MDETIRVDEPNFTQEFYKARFTAGTIINEHIENSKYPNDWRWIKTKLAWPAFDHLTFGYRNQVFCVVVDLIKAGKSTATKDLLSNLIRECTYNNLVPCIAPIKVPQMKPVHKGWNLVHAETGEPVRPEGLATEERIPLSEWELDNWAVSIAIQHLEADKYEILSYSDLLGYAPQVWFKDAADKPNWLCVKHSVYPSAAEQTFEIAPNFRQYQGWQTEVIFKGNLCRNAEVQARYCGMSIINKI
jgi:hypothetical protein